MVQIDEFETTIAEMSPGQLSLYYLTVTSSFITLSNRRRSILLVKGHFRLVDNCLEYDYNFQIQILILKHQQISFSKDVTNRLRKTISNLKISPKRRNVG